jgi:predicted acetyltransferase
MGSISDKINIRKCEFDEIKPFVSEYYISNKIIVDSFWEDHILEKSNYYIIMHDNEIAGYFCVNSGTLLVLFNVFEEYRHFSQEIFFIVKKYESIKEVLVPTGDEFFLSHAIDNYEKIEKQAYFLIYTGRAPGKIIEMEYILADLEKDIDILNLERDFLEIDRILNLTNLDTYIVKHENNVIGFGVIEYNNIVNIYASIGMIVREGYRQKGYGANILQKMKDISISKGKIPVSGCWYYNHNSKKTIEKAGAYSSSRLLRFYF